MIENTTEKITKEAAKEDVNTETSESRRLKRWATNQKELSKALESWSGSEDPSAKAVITDNPKPAQAAPRLAPDQQVLKEIESLLINLKDQLKEFD